MTDDADELASWPDDADDEGDWNRGAREMLFSCDNSNITHSFSVSYNEAAAS